MGSILFLFFLLDILLGFMIFLKRLCLLPWPLVFLEPENLYTQNAFQAAKNKTQKSSLSFNCLVVLAKAIALEKDANSGE